MVTVIAAPEDVWCDGALLYPCRAEDCGLAGGAVSILGGRTISEGHDRRPDLERGEEVQSGLFEISD